MKQQKQQVTFRGLNEADRLTVAQWLRDDPEHQRADERIFNEPAVGRSQMVLETNGEPLFYVTVENIARVHIQFNPRGNVFKNLKALVFGFTWIKEQLKARGYFELVFDSRYDKLIRFCQKALGFVKNDTDYSVRF